MTRYTVQAGYAVYVYATVSVEADSIEDACRAAIQEADATERWKASDHVGDAFVAAIGEGADACPWSGPVSALPVPDRFSERGTPPLITVIGPGPSGGIDVAGGTVRVRFVEDAGTVTTEISDPPPPGNKPLVTVRRRADGAPDTEVRGGKAIVRVEGWDAADEVVQPG